ncbi:hypothetical protein FIBSPDRAFT_963762 [Athelia psychrophila]|uniref:Uncharacterized protein n=1 Tax=Athelia psychrophila TaxID=1759441 RepID=A0A165YMM7_9AGAM|nr:hypothetical protein FIBSPDRAFT_963762 [Fibularhizoctonia sp. CBS 109695]
MSARVPLPWPDGGIPLSPFLGPITGPLVGGFINRTRTGAGRGGIWRVVPSAKLATQQFYNLVPETYAPVLYKWKAARLRVSTHDERCYAPLDGKDINLVRVVVISCYKLFQRMTYDRMALLNAWNAHLLGILYLA